MVRFLFHRSKVLFLAIRCEKRGNCQSEHADGVTGKCHFLRKWLTQNCSETKIHVLSLSTLILCSKGLDTKDRGRTKEPPLPPSKDKICDYDSPIKQESCRKRKR